MPPGECPGIPFTKNLDMKTYRLLSLAGVSAMLLLFAVDSAAQQKRDPYIEAQLQQNRSRAAINTHSYEFLPVHDTPAPKGYKPVYISHYGRHGSRSNWGAQGYLRVIDALQQAKDEGILTPDGNIFLEEAREIYTQHNGMDGRLTQRGVNEHRMIAERMYKRYPAVFKKQSKKVRSIASTVPRCIISMVGFTDRLTELQKDLDIRWDTGETYMLYINNSAPDTVNRASRVLLGELSRDYTPDTTYFFQRMFTDPEKAKAITGNASRFQSSAMSIACMGESFEVDDDMYRFFPFDAVYKSYENSAMSLYLQHCNSVELGKEAVSIAKPLVEDIVNKADEALRTGEYCVDLRFGHDFPILTLFGYLGLEGAGDRLTMQEARYKWFATDWVPFAANLQMIFYKNNSGDVLVKFLVNEKETLLRGVEPFSGPYYKWETVKKNTEGYLR